MTENEKIEELQKRVAWLEDKIERIVKVLERLVDKLTSE